MSDEPDFRRSRRKSQPIDPAKADRLPPSAIEAEQGALGSIFLNPQENMPEAQSRILTSEVWYDLRHRTIWETLVEMANDNDPIDSITVQGRLKAFGQLDAIGGVAYLSSLPDSVPSAANLGFYITVILEKYQLRKLIQLCQNTVHQVYESEGDPGALLDEFEAEALKVRVMDGNAVTTNCAAAVDSAIGMIDDYVNKKGAISGLPTGFPDFDKMTHGLHDSEMVVIAGRPSMGKSSLAMNFIEEVVLNQNVPTGMFSLEMSKESLMLRTICSRARVNLRNIRDGFLAERDYPKLAGAAGKLRKAPLYIDDTPGLTITQLRARARRLKQQFGIRMLVVDYLQNMQIVVKKGESRQNGFADVSNGLKLLARELNIPVVVLSQISRLFDREKNRKPTMADLKETGAIEQDADLIGILYKPGSNDDDSQESDAMPVNLLICKQRNGPTGDVHLTFLKSYTRFESAAKISGDDVPGDQENFSYNQPHAD